MSAGLVPWIKKAVATHRRSRPVRLIHRVARLFEDAYANVGSDVSENGEADLIHRLAPSAFRVAFDVGANFGDWSATALAAWPKVQIHAFEVAPTTFSRLKIRLAGVEKSNRVVLNDVGLSAQTGSAEMFFFPEHPELTCDRPRHEGLEVSSFTAQLLAGDDYVATQKIDRIDFLKIDVEGAEHSVLRGFSKTLEADRISCIQFEFGAFSIQTRVLLADYYDLLAARFWIGKIYPAYVDFQDYSWMQEDFRFTNYFCVSRDRPDLRDLAAG